MYCFRFTICLCVSGWLLWNLWYNVVLLAWDAATPLWHHHPQNTQRGYGQFSTTTVVILANCINYIFKQLSEFLYTPKLWKYMSWYTGVSWRLVCWLNVMSQTPPTIFKSSKWNLVQMISMQCKYTWLNFCGAWPKSFHVTKR